MWKNLLLLLVLGSFLTLDSCHNTDNVKKKSLKIFKYNENAGISSTDPAYAKDQSNIWCVNHLYNGLVQLDNQLQIQPCLAKSWKISEDGLTYTFYLIDDVYFIEDKCFESKRRLIASDIVYSFNRIIDSKTASPGAWIFRDKIDNKEAFMALNDTTFQYFEYAIYFYSSQRSC
jgi:peptide/nickel transport system substrate-binding protein